MSDVLIKNMEMPKDCSLCPFALLENGGRNFFCLRQIGKRFDSKLCEQRQEGCPLVEVQTHGDLIDRQKLLEHRFEVYDSNEEVCEDYIETYHVLEAPSIVEASKER